MSIERIYFNNPIENSSSETFLICREIAEYQRDVPARRRIMPVGEHIVTPPIAENFTETHRLRVWEEGHAIVTQHRLTGPQDIANEENIVMTVKMPQDTRMVLFHAPRNGKDWICGMLYYRPLESPLW